MSFKKQIIILGSVAVVLACTLAAGLLAQVLGAPSQGGGRLLASDFDSSAVQRITISTGAASIVLTHDSTGWQVARTSDQVPASTRRVEDFIKTLAATTVVRSVSESADSHTRLGLAKESASRLEITRGTKTDAWLFGTSSERGDEQFARRADADRVVAVSSGLGFWLQQNDDFWTDKRLWPESLKADEISRITLETPKGMRIALKRGAADQLNNWSVEGKGSERIQKDQISNLVSALPALDGDSTLVLDAAGIPSGYVYQATLGLQLKDGRELKADLSRPIEAKPDPASSASWLAIPRYGEAPRTRNGKTIGILFPAWKLQTTVLGLE